jgi:hypothetical protein
MTKEVDYFLVSDLSDGDQALFSQLSGETYWHAVTILEELAPVLLKDCFEYFMQWKTTKTRMEKCNPYILIPMGW